MKSECFGARAAWLAVVLGVASLAGGTEARGESVGPPAPPFGEWTALGSGCRGGAAGPGFVTEEIVPGHDPSVWRVRFHLDGFHLSTDERAAGEALTFARECGMRFVIAPPRGMRTVLVASESRIEARKSAGAKLTLHGDLRLGAAPIASHVVTYEAEGARSGEEQFTLAPGTSSMPSLDCGESKVAALDLTWIVHRDAASQSAHVEVVAPGTVEIEVRMERCG
jgi:hypothetical protein